MYMCIRVYVQRKYVPEPTLREWIEREGHKDNVQVARWMSQRISSKVRSDLEQLSMRELGSNEMIPPSSAI